MKDKKGITITNAFQQILNESNRKPNTTWVDKGSEFYNRWIKSRLQDNDIGMYSTIMSGNVFKLIKALKNLQKYDFSFKKCVYKKSDEIVNKYSNTYHSTIKMR